MSSSSPTHAKTINQSELTNKTVNPKISTESPILRSFLAGALSGTCSTILLQPLDLIKTRLQQSPGSNILKEFRHVLQTDGVLGFWTGVTPSLWRTVPGIGLYFSSYHTISDIFTSDGRKMTSSQSLFVGTMSRVCAGTLLIPVTVVKTRWEAGGTQFQYKGVGVFGSIKTILATEGVKGLTTGLIPTILRDAPYSGIYLMLYNKLKQMAANSSEKGTTNQTTNFVCGLLAGAMATIIVQPADVVKTRLQLNEGRSSMTRETFAIYKKRGVGGFMVGVVPRVVRKSLMSALAWTVYEQAIDKMMSKL